MSRYVDFITMRTYDHARLEEVAAHASIPVINALTDLNHPCQVLADLLTVHEWAQANGRPLVGRGWESLTVSYVGDGNNMTHSWIEAALQLHFKLAVSIPPGHEIDAAYADCLAAAPWISLNPDPQAAVSQADVVTTDTWFSMGQAVSPEKQAALAPYQVNDALMARAHPDAIFLHCLPAHRGEEVTATVIDGPASRIFDEAENRLHVQKAILTTLSH